ncbi:hypothetical protein F5Y18DRAFT_444871 [Xylariaceae sp. FL1019]|nr:hypothetical protein F5Y18DRAFT_444871 [Xylariaceae sp. FL1019]
MTNLGPVPTNFAIPSSCAEDLQSAYLYHMPAPAQGWWLVQGQVEQTTCYPSGYAALGVGQIYYSPARCPVGFTRACQTLQHVATATETIETCCPTHMVYECQLETSKVWPWQNTLGCVSELQSDGVYTLNTVSNGFTHQVVSTLMSGNGFNAYSIQIRYQSTDFLSSTAFSSTQRTQSTSSTGTPFVPPPTGNPRSNDTDDTQNAYVISAGAAAGIAIASFTGFLIVIAGLWYFIRRKRQQHQVLQPFVEPRNQSHPGFSSHYHRFGSAPVGPQRGRSSGGEQTAINELEDGPQGAVELNGQPSPRELHAKTANFVTQPFATNEMAKGSPRW